MPVRKTPLTVRPPYPESTTTTPTEELYSPSLLESPAFDLTDLSEAQRAEKITRSSSSGSDATAIAGGVALPESLRIGAEGPSGAQSPTRGSNEMWRDFKKDEAEIPESLRPGGGAARAKSPVAPKTYMHGALETDPEVNPWTEKKTDTQVQEAGVRKNQEKVFDDLPVPGREQNALPVSFLPGDAAVGTKSLPTSEPGPHSPVKMSANLMFSDRPFSEFSPFYSPQAPSLSPAPASAPASNPNLLEISSRRPSVAATNSPNSEAKGRQPSVASSISSVAFEPGVDMSSFDASTTRAFPARRRLSAVGMDDWKEDDAEDDIAKTWEEELDRRAKAGAELQRRTEAAAERDREERLQAEFWEEERRLALPAVEGPQKPPKPELPVRQPTPESRALPLPPPTPPQLPARQPPPSATTTTEIYQIKHIAWLPPTTTRSSNALRLSPILLQADNGPCPLLALVNALILSTPDGTDTALLSTLQAREQISLELLLDVVFQELMDRGGAAGLQDVGDLFAFLLTLHTGMNVNPRFYPSSTPESREYAGFEPTREMELYGAFKVRLVHGWLPEPNHPVIPALKRRKIANYEDAQALLFTEEEIINRITTAGATVGPSESEIINDAAIIREFMENTKTQLTSYGLDEVRKGLNPGDIAILFRNDHFMTIIGGRDNTALHGLVTDAGFATHEEVVWESMIDVQGHANNFLSGDFRPVGGAQQQPQQRPVQSLLDPNEGWEPIPESIRTEGQTLANDTTDHDADLALAMMLQEEEDENHRRAQEAHRARSAQPQSRNLPPSQPHNAPPTPPRPPPGAGVHTHRPADPAETIPPPPYERVPSSSRPAATPRENMGAYQAMAQQQQRGGHGRSVSAGPGLIAGAGGSLSSTQRQQAARGLLHEIAGSGAAAAGSGRRGSGGVQGGQRRQSIPGPDDKEKCVIC